MKHIHSKKNAIRSVSKRPHASEHTRFGSIFTKVYYRASLPDLSETLLQAAQGHV